MVIRRSAAEKAARAASVILPLAPLPPAPVERVSVRVFVADLFREAKRLGSKKS